MTTYRDADEARRKASAAPDEVERRRALVRSAFHSNALAGLQPNSDCQPAFDAYVAGEIDIEELGARIKDILGVH